MNKYIVKYLLGMVMLLSIVSCKKNNVVVDQDPLSVPEAARFLKAPLTDNFYILSTPSGGSIYKIPIGVTTVSSENRTIQLTYQARLAVNGAQYKAPLTITIPAGKAVDTLIIQGLFDGYTVGRKDTLKIKMVKGDGLISPNAYSDSVVLIMQKYCSVDLTVLAGTYANTDEYRSSGAHSWGPYTTVLKDVQTLTATTGKGLIENLYDYGWNDIEATFDWSDPANFKVAIAKQNTGTLEGGFPVYVRSTPGKTNTFSSCDQTFSLTVDLLGGATGTEMLDPGPSYQIRMKR
jgi:hypothetical protein